MYFAKRVIRGVPREGWLCCLDGDLALTSQRYSDFSALAGCRIAPAPNGKWQMVVLDVDFGRWKSTEIAHPHRDVRKKHLEARSFYLERISGTELLQREVNMLALRYRKSRCKARSGPPREREGRQDESHLGLQILLEDDDRLLRFVNGNTSMRCSSNSLVYRGVK